MTKEQELLERIDSLTSTVNKMVQLLIEEQKSKETLKQELVASIEESVCNRIFGYIKNWTGLDPKREESFIEISETFRFANRVRKASYKTVSVAFSSIVVIVCTGFLGLLTSGSIS